MSCSRRNFLTGAGAVIFTTGVAGTAVISSKKTLASVQEDGDKRYGMIHDETACIGCTACTEACREVNNVPEGVSRLEIVRSEPKVNSLMLITVLPEILVSIVITPLV